MFTDATRAMAVGSGEKDNKKALAQRKRQVVFFWLFVCSFGCLFVWFGFFACLAQRKKSRWCVCLLRKKQVLLFGHHN